MVSKAVTPRVPRIPQSDFKLEAPGPGQQDCYTQSPHSYAGQTAEDPGTGQPQEAVCYPPSYDPA